MFIPFVCFLTLLLVIFLCYMIGLIADVFGLKFRLIREKEDKEEIRENLEYIERDSTLKALDDKAEVYEQNLVASRGNRVSLDPQRTILRMKEKWESIDHLRSSVAGGRDPSIIEWYRFTYGVVLIYSFFYGILSFLESYFFVIFGAIGFVVFWFWGVDVVQYFLKTGRFLILVLSGIILFLISWYFYFRWRLQVACSHASIVSRDAGARHKIPPALIWYWGKVFWVLSRGNTLRDFHDVDTRSSLSTKLLWGHIVFSVEQLSPSIFKIICCKPLKKGVMKFDEKILTKNHPEKASFFCGHGNGYSWVPLGKSHVICAGKTGSGKSTAVRNILVTLLTAYKDRVVLMGIDLKDGLESFLFDQYYEKLATNVKDAVGLIEKFYDLLNERKKLFTDVRVKDHEAYEKKTGKKIPFYVLFFDEYAEFIGALASSNLEKKVNRKYKSINLVESIARKGRAYGVLLFITLQRPDGTVITQQLKSQCGLKLVGKMEDNASSGVVLSNGSAFHSLPDEEPGIFILSHTGANTFTKIPLMEEEEAEEYLEKYGTKKRVWNSTLKKFDTVGKNVISSVKKLDTPIELKKEKSVMFKKIKNLLNKPEVETKKKGDGIKNKDSKIIDKKKDEDDGIENLVWDGIDV